MRLLALLAWSLGIRRRVALENLALAFPEKSEQERRAIARANYLHLGVCAAEFLQSPARTDASLQNLVEPEGWEKVQPLLDAGEGFVVCTAHFGNFELFGAWVARRGVPLTILTRRLRGRANARWTGTRTESGVREVHAGPTELIRVVRQGGVLALLIDQNMLPKRAVFAPFFGQLAATTPAPAIIAERTGCKTFLAFMLRKPDGRYRTVIEGPFELERRGDRQADVLRFTTEMNERLERYVRAYPEQWFWMHRRWKTRPPGERLPEPGQER